MSLQCPECDHKVSEFELLTFMRFFSANCPQCNSLLAIDGRSRAIMAVSVFGSIALGFLVGWLSESTIAAIVVMFVGPVLGFHLVANYGHIGLSPEDRE